ncbi:MAG: reverse transcriptase domain-containing protein, partial [Candidatus Thiodiazotropha sp.]
MPTPVRASTLYYYLAGYDAIERDFLYQGFAFGFRIPFQGPRVSRVSHNHISATRNPSIVKQKINEEILAGRVRGPFRVPPCEPLICSPLAIVPKHEVGSYRLIHDLSFPRNASVNSGIDKLDSQVVYDNIDRVISLITGRQQGAKSLMAKTDISNAFRLLPINAADRCLLGFTWPDGNGCLQYYIDCALPMGLSAACQCFERFSSALQWIMTIKFGAVMSHILDDFFFIGPPNSNKCSADLSKFVSLCADIGIPLKQEKTVWPTTKLVIYGIEVDSVEMVSRLPEEKVLKIKNLLSVFSKRKKVTLRELQSLLGLLNFATGCVVPGRAFLRRLFDLTINVSHPNFYIKLNRKAKADLAAWELFMSGFNGKHVLLNDDWVPSDNLCLYTDAASTKGFAGVFGNKWFMHHWPAEFTSFHINILELFP